MQYSPQLGFLNSSSNCLGSLRLFTSCLYSLFSLFLLPFLLSSSVSKMLKVQHADLKYYYNVLLVLV